MIRTASAARLWRGLPLLLTTALLVAPAVGGDVDQSQALPRDERVQTGKLANGVTWMYRQHATPPGKMALLIHVRTGSLNETEAQRGLAHFLEHMAFNGSENFPGNKLVEYMESIGMEFGADVNAMTSFDQTMYMLFLPDTTPDQVERGLMALSDQVFRMQLDPEEIDKERGVILAELTAGMSAAQRIRDAFIAKVFAGTRLSERLPIGLESVIRGATRDDFSQYYRTWYRPERITLIMVGDAAPEPYLPLVEKWFGKYTAELAAKDPVGPGLKPFGEARGFVISDPEYHEGSVDFYNVQPGHPAADTVGDERDRLVERAGAWMMQRRLAERAREGTATYREAAVGISGFPRTVDGTLVSASAAGDPGEWEAMLDELIVEVSRAREHGFNAYELDLARKALLAQAEDAVETEETQPARQILMRTGFSVHNEAVLMSATDRYEIWKALLPTLELGEVNEVFAAHYAPGGFAYVVTLPEKPDVKLPTDAEVLAAARAAQARKTEPLADEDRGEPLLESEPTPGRIVERTRDEDLDITSGWLENGVRFHHRFMDYEQGRVYVTVTLAGGEIEETAENAGITSAATLVIRQPATSRLSSSAINDLMTGRKIQVSGGGRDDMVTFMVSGSPDDLEMGLRLVHALITDGQIEESAFEHWQQAMVQQYERQRRVPMMIAYDALLQSVSGNDPRRKMLRSPEQLEPITRAAAQAWFERICSGAPIEVAIVGELSLDDAEPLLEKYLGSLAPRPRDASSLAPLRVFAREKGPYTHKLDVDTMTPQAMVVVGMLGCEASNVPRMRALNLASNILDMRLIKRVREELGLVYTVRTQNVPGQAYTNGGFFFAGAPCDPDGASVVTIEIDQIFGSLAAEGPTAEEMEQARGQVLNNLDEVLREPTFWVRQLQDLHLHGADLNDLKDIPAAYEAISAEQVQQVFADYWKDDGKIHIRAFPTHAEAPTTQPVP
jgi:zinc protease